MNPQARAPRSRARLGGMLGIVLLALAGCSGSRAVAPVPAPDPTLAEERPATPPAPAPKPAPERVPEPEPAAEPPPIVEAETPVPEPAAPPVRVDVTPADSARLTEKARTDLLWAERQLELALENDPARATNGDERVATIRNLIESARTALDEQELDAAAALALKARLLTEEMSAD